MQGLAFIASDALASVSRLDSGNLVHLSSTWTGDIPPELSQARITKAKIFIKLDIQQAFYRIRISPESKKLTTF
jgi:hypothetical protein